MAIAFIISDLAPAKRKPVKGVATLPPTGGPALKPSQATEVEQGLQGLVKEIPATRMYA